MARTDNANLVVSELEVYFLELVSTVLTHVLALVSVAHMLKLQCPLMTQGDRAQGRLVHPSVGGQRVGFSVTSELNRVCIVHLVHAALGVN